VGIPAAGARIRSTESETDVASVSERDGVTVDDVVDASELARA
jgi:hypothetical protein